MNRSKKSANRIRKLLVICSLMTVIIAASTYAWFVGMKTVNVSSFDVEIETTESLLLSLNGIDWGDTLNISSSTFDSSSYVGNTNKWAGRGLIPMSTVGAMDSGSSRMMIYEKASLTSTPGGYRLMASRVDNYSVPTAEEPDGYVVFDLFIKNFSGVQYLENLNILDEEAIYLSVDSEVTVAESGVANTGIENSVRVAFAQVGRVKGTTTDAAKITGLICAPTQGSGVTGICRTNIWEPNESNHESNAINWYEASCLARTGTDVTAEESYSGPCEAITDGTAYPTYGTRDDILLADNVDIYDGAEYNGYTPNSKIEVIDTFTDTDKLLTGTSRPAFMMLAPNSITKVRVYIYIEGQDIDNYDFASIGKAISVKFGFTKERFKEEDIKPVIPADNCFAFNSTTKTITSYYNYESNVSSNPACPKSIIVPTTINGTVVTAIGNDAFRSKALKKVRIQNNITSIGTYAFYDNDIINLKLSEGITTIRDYAFSKNDLTTVIIPNSVTTLGSSVFRENLISSATLPSGLTAIPNAAFYKNKLTSIVIPSTVNSIGSSAFSDNLLTNFDVPAGVTIIDGYSFQNNKLTSVTLPSSLLTISTSAFQNNLLTNISIHNSVTTIGSNAFYKNKLTAVVLPNNLTSVGYWAFMDNDITSVEIPSSVTTIIEGAFMNNELASVTFNSGLISIGNYGFSGNKLTSVIIPNTVTSIGTSAFGNNEIVSVTLPNNISNINSYAFSNNKITSLVIPSSVRTIGEMAFFQNQIANLTLPSSLLSIGSMAFYENQITSLTLPSTLTNIRDYAFYNNKLTSITIPSSVSILEDGAFLYNDLQSVCIKGKSNSSAFTTYGQFLWGWNYAYDDSNITWNCTD